MATTSTITSPMAGLPANMMVGGKAASASSTEEAATSADRFLKLLVTQMQNQDPLNPMDNAQVTSQMAQINTVNGIDKVNTSLQGLSGQFMQLQVMQGAALVGHDVVVPGNRLAVQGHVAHGGFELNGPANAVKVQVSTTSGQLLDTVELGAKSPGIQSFEWDATAAMKAGIDPAGLRFQVISTTGGVSKEASPLMRDRVNSINTDGKNLNLELDISGSVSYSAVKAFS